METHRLHGKELRPDGERQVRTASIIAAVAAACLSACSAPTNTGGGSAADTSFSAAPATSANLAAPATAFYQRFQEVTQACDTAGDEAKALLKRGDTVGGYQALAEAQDQCKAAFMAVTNLQVPEVENTAMTALGAAKDVCGVAYWSKRNAYRDVAKVINGDERPSAQATAAQSSTKANDQLGACVAQMMKAVHDAGGAVPELDAAK
jgi:hypothetical protein